MLLDLSAEEWFGSVVVLVGGRVSSRQICDNGALRQLVCKTMPQDFAERENDQTEHAEEFFFLNMSSSKFTINS